MVLIYSFIPGSLLAWVAEPAWTRLRRCATTCERVQGTLRYVFVLQRAANNVLVCTEGTRLHKN